jgi:hypothetical protein
MLGRRPRQMVSPDGATWSGAGDSAFWRPVARWFHHKSGAIEQVGWRLTRTGFSFIVRAIPGVHVVGEISLNWEIPVNLIQKRTA